MSHRNTVAAMINAEITQNHNLRRPLLAEIGEYFKSTVISFYVTHNHWQGYINDEDASMLKDLLVSVGETSNLVLIIDSPGGEPHSAERIIKSCRGCATNKFFTLVPDKAKSAATMICLGSDCIYMLQDSELGPIDVQVPWGNRLLPAHVIIKSYEELIEKCKTTPTEQRVEPFLQQLQAYNAAQVEHLRLTRDLAREIAEKNFERGYAQRYSREAAKCDFAEFS